VADALQPVAPEERIRALDLLRGWAMFGVLWSNINDYGTREPVTRLDHALSWTQTWLVEGRFYSLLILLFGMGFGIQLIRSENQATDLRGTYYRRATALLAIGIVHGTLIWQGDILTIYALVAFALVMFRTASTRRILIAALLLWFVGTTIVREAMHLSGLRVILPDSSGESSTIYAHGTWLDIERVRVSGYLQWLGRWGLTSYVSILASFLMGLWAVKSGYLRRVIGEPRVTSRLLAVALGAAALGYAMWHWANTLWPPVRAPDNVVPAFPFPYFQLAMLRQFVLRFLNWATEGTALAYACVLLLLWQRPLGQRLLGPLAATGRMALTTYLTQSIVCTLLFYSYGLGWYGSFGFTGMLLITLILFACQMAASTWWLARFRYGPAEWLWRTLTYGRAPEMRVAPE
jgi:uncharacterized protein